MMPLMRMDGFFMWLCRLLLRDRAAICGAQHALK
jgi:hypothetical protein